MEAGKLLGGATDELDALEVIRKLLGDTSLCSLDVLEHPLPQPGPGQHIVDLGPPNVDNVPVNELAAPLGGFSGFGLLTCARECCRQTKAGIERGMNKNPRSLLVVE